MRALRTGSTSATGAAALSGCTLQLSSSFAAVSSALSSRMCPSTSSTSLSNSSAGLPEVHSGTERPTRSFGRAVVRRRLAIRTEDAFRLLQMHPHIMLRRVTGHRLLEFGLPRESQNTARETRARFEYQDACVV